MEKGFFCGMILGLTAGALWKKLFDGINDILDGVTLSDVAQGKVK